MVPKDQWLFPSFRHQILTEQSIIQPHTTSNKESAKKEVSSDVNPFLTPSIEEMKITWQMEHQLRWSTCSFIEDLAQQIGMPDAPSIVAQMYIQRFYMLHSFKKHDRFIVASSALFLAGKVEEFPIKVRVIAEGALYLLIGRKNFDKNFSMTSKKKKNDVVDGDGKSASHLDCLNALLDVIDVGEIDTTAAKILFFERILLQTLSFEVGMIYPFTYVPKYMDQIFALEAIHSNLSRENIRSMSFLFLSDAIKSGLCLAFDSKELASGAVYLSCLFLQQVNKNVATKENKPWWSIFGYEAKQLEEICCGLLWIYSDKTFKGGPFRHVPKNFSVLWKIFPPQENVPDLAYVKEIDANIIE